MRQISAGFLFILLISTEIASSADGVDIHADHLAAICGGLA
jgi:hypothetical protein